MLEIVNSENLRYLAPHVYHTIRDNSAVPVPFIGFNGITTYAPIYTEKGPTGQVKLFKGPSAYSDLLATYGNPNAKKYGLPYSGLVLHAERGGAVVAQSIKSPGATHSAIVVVMKVKRSNVKQPIAWVFDNKPGVDGNTPAIPFTSKKTGKVEYVIRAFKPDFNPLVFDEDELTDEVKLTNQVRTTNLYADKLYDVDTLDLSRFDQIEDPEVKKAQIAAFREKHSNFVKCWKKIEVPSLEITFESLPIEELVEQAKGHDKKKSRIQGVTSWEVLELLVSSIKPVKTTGQFMTNTTIPDTLDDIIQRLKEESSSPDRDSETIIYQAPIFWGYCIGKGVYGNNYEIKFESTTTSDENPVPVLAASIIDIKTGAAIPTSRKTVAFSNVFSYGSPLLLDTVYTPANGFTGEFKFATASTNTFNNLGYVIQDVLGYFLGYKEKGTMRLGGVAPMFANFSYGVVGDNLIDNIKKQVLEFNEPEDSSLHRLSFTDFTRLKDKPGLVKSGGLLQYGFSGGHEGELKFMKEFDWKFNFEDKKLNELYGKDPEFRKYKEMYGNRKIVEEMFENAMLGRVNPEIKSLWANPADYVIDFGYPLSVKKAMYQFFKPHRDEVQMLFNTDIRNNTLDEAIGYKKNLDTIQGRNVYWFPGNFEWIDPFSSRSIRVPQTFALIPTLLEHYSAGFARSLAGVNSGMLELVEPNTGRGYGNMSLEENSKAIKHGVNIMSVYSGGKVYLDSQMANYKLHARSHLQEFHNNSIINRMLKDCYIVLQEWKHALASDASAEKIQEVVTEKLSKYLNKVEDFSYHCAFETSYDKAIGQLTHSIDVKFFGTIKYHKVVLTALPIS